MRHARRLGEKTVPVTLFRSGARVLVCSLTLWVAGCQVNQDQDVAAYREVTDLAGPLPASTQPIDVLPLRDALLLANAYNERLSIDGEAYLRTLIARRRAVANFLPTVDLVPFYLFREDTDDGGDGDDGGGGGSSQSETLDVPVDMNINLFNGFRDINRYWSDTWRIEEQRNRLLSSQEALLLDVAQVYYLILRSEASVRVLENSLRVQDERLRDTRGRFEAGVARSLDVAQTEAQVSATRIALITARSDVLNARALLALLTNAPVRQSELTDAYELPADVGEVGRHLAIANEQRNELRAAAAAIEAARRDVDVAVGQYYPSVALDFSVFVYRESVPDERTWTGLLSANLPIFDAGRIHADVREAWSFFRQALLVRSLLSREVTQEILTTHQNLTASQARLAELEITLRAAEQAFDQAEQSYRAGIATNLERITAQDALLEAQLAQANEEYDQKIFHLRLLRSAGVLRETLESMR